MSVTTVTFNYPGGVRTPDDKPAGRELAMELSRIVRGDRSCTDPDHEDFGWFIEFVVADAPTCFVFGFRADDEGGVWVGKVERDLGFISTIFGRRGKRVPFAALEFVHKLLVGVPEISNVLWYDDSRFDRSDESAPFREPPRFDD